MSCSASGKPPPPSSDYLDPAGVGSDVCDSQGGSLDVERGIMQFLLSPVFVSGTPFRYYGIVDDDIVYD